MIESQHQTLLRLVLHSTKPDRSSHKYPEPLSRSVFLLSYIVLVVLPAPLLVNSIPLLLSPSPFHV